MVLRTLSQLNFRNLSTPRLELCAGMTAVVGANGAGKSNLLDACFLALTGEIPGGRIAENLRIGEESGYVAALVDHDEGSSTIEIGLAPGRKSLRLDGQAVRTHEISQVSAAVLVTPQDADLVHGSPGNRRSYLDSLLSRLSKRYALLHREYLRVLEQRNAGLKAGLGEPELAVWTSRLVELGSEIWSLRERAVVRVAEHASAAYTAISGGNRTLGVRLLRPEASLDDALRASRAEERARGATVVGPHRDDLVLELDGMAMSAYGSRGEARTAALALRVAEYRLLEQRHGEGPVLLLDDFSAELDPSRRSFLLELVSGTPQALVSGTEPPPSSDDLLRVAEGSVTRA